MTIQEKVVEALTVYRNATYRVFTTSGLILTIVLILTFSLTYLIDVTLNFLAPPVNLFHPDFIAIIIALVSAILTMAIWWILGVKYAPKLGALLTEKKIMNILFTKGDIHYFEKVEPETLRIMPGNIIGKFINLLLSWFAVTAFLLGFLLPFFSPSASSDKLYAFFIASPANIVDYFLKLVIVFVLAPLLMTLTVPIPWMLIDTKLKAYSSGAKINSFVGKAVQARLNSLFAIGGIVTLLVQNLSLNIIILTIAFIFSFLAFPTILMVTLYNLLFQVKYYEKFLREIPVPFGTTRIDMETKFTKPAGESSNKPLDDLSSTSDNPS